MAFTVLAIETSCDDTSIAVLTDGTIKANVVSSQLKHSTLGGVVPELASRLHLTNIAHVVQEAVIRSGIGSFNDLDLIAYTSSPGLMGALMVGNCYAKGLALALNKPMMAVNHMEGHVMSLFLSEKKISFPFLCLTVSGGHTQIEQVNGFFERKIMGKTRDDAAGEAFDKTAKLLGLPYPGGPVIDRLAKEGDPHFHIFPTPKVDGLDFSFSGLKTSILYYLQEQIQKDPLFVQNNISNLCASVQYRIVHFLLDKLFLASETYQIKQLGIVGGVSANSYLRAEFEKRCFQKGCEGFIPAFEYCTDNAAMIGITAYHRYLENPLTVSNYYEVASPN